MLNKLSLRFRKYFTFYRHTECYDEAVMPSELRKAHQENDCAITEAYGFAKDITEREIVAELFKMYERLVKLLNA